MIWVDHCAKVITVFKYQTSKKYKKIHFYEYLSISYKLIMISHCKNYLKP